MSQTLTAADLRAASRAGVVAGFTGLLLGCGLVLGIFQLSTRWEALLASAGAVLFASLATLRLGRWAGRRVLRSGFLHALWVGPLCGVLTLISSTFGVALGNLPTLIRKVGEGGAATEGVASYALLPVVWGTLWGLVPAALLGLLCGLGLWAWLESRFE